MVDLLQGLQSLFNADTGNGGLVATFGKLWLTKAPDGTPLPICVVSPITSDPSYMTTKTTINRYTIQFSVFATSAEACVMAMDSLTRVFDWAQPPLTASKYIEARRGGIFGPTTEDEKVFNSYVQYFYSIAEDLPR